MDPFESAPPTDGASVVALDVDSRPPMESLGPLCDPSIVGPAQCTQFGLEKLQALIMKQ
jgi:hypothetical protein